MQHPPAPADPFFGVVLHEPEIPNNTGNIGRTCLTMGAALHLVEPLGFSLDEKALRRAGLDYWPRLAPSVHANWPAYESSYPNPTRWYFTARRGRPAFEAPLRRGDHLVFGRETVGLPGSVLRGNEDRCVHLPMLAGERSLNLATAVCAALCEGVRQLVARGEAAVGDAGELVDRGRRTAEILAVREQNRGPSV
ncbi:MAG: tRNA (cytidine(34)-2'-O)-methyltransferase [Planctomycetota bacterium]